MKMSSDARGFIEGITEYIQKGEKQSVLPKVQELLGKVATQAQKETVAKVTSSAPLTMEEEKMIHQLLYQLIRHSVTLEKNIDKTLIAGIQIAIGDWVVDTSLKSQLEQMGKEISQ
ncbi:ATP synthase F1 subunit delta [Candidatus Gottesmanbacteria bacterium]|nr:ATP synthase F1 subunit delta [Candidatus Gottesmanbacteria bacterium]